jgi:hypothetical protein
MDRTKATAAFPKLFAEIREVVFRHDPSGLFGMGPFSACHTANFLVG